MKLVRIAYSLLKLAALPMKVLSADRRGVIIGLGQPISIPSLAQGVEGGEIKTTENYPKKLHWDPEKNIWTYIYLSKGLPLRGDTIGLGERGMVAYYKVTKSTPTLIQLDLVKDQKMPKGSAESMFKSTLKFDAETIREIRTPYYYKQIVLKSEKHQRQLQAVPALKDMFANAEKLAKDAYSKYSKGAPESADQKPTITKYTESVVAHGQLNGYADAYKNILQFLDTVDGDERTLAKFRSHVEKEIEATHKQISKQEAITKDLKEQLHKQPDRRAASYKLANLLYQI